MNYQEKIQLAEKGTELVSEGKSINFYENKLKDEGLDRFDIEKVVRSIKNQVSDKYGSRFKKLLQENILEENKKEFAFLDEDIYYYIKEKEINNIKEDAKQNIKELIHKTRKKKVNVDDIVNLTNKQYLSKTEIKDYIDNYYKKNKYLNPNRRKFNLFMGIILIVVAIWNFSMGGRIFSLLSLSILGIISIYRSYKK